MNEHCRENLNQLRFLLKEIDCTDYCYHSELLFGASIGQHIRHVLEFYQCLFMAIDGQKIVNYDKRVRDLALESDTSVAISVIDTICTFIKSFDKDIALILEGNFGVNDALSVQINTSYYRELAYCLEHSIHHQALIKIGLKELNLSHIIDHNFGVAPATIRYNTVLK